MQQTLLFNEMSQVEIEKPKTGKGSGKPRGKYKPRQPKPKVISPYKEVQDIYYEIALLLNPSILFQPPKEESIEFKYFNFRHVAYNDELYTYDGEEYRGENFNIINAELKGTETLGIKERVFLHRSFLNLVNQGNSVKQAAEIMQPIILKFQEGMIFSDQQIDTME